MAGKVIAKSDTHAGLRDKLQAAVTAKHGTPNGNDYYDTPYVHDVTDKKVIHSKSGKENRGKLFSSPYKTDDKGAVTLGEPAEVEPAYKPIAESEFGPVNEAESFAEAATQSKPYNAKTKELTVTIIKPGFNKSKSRFYSPAALKESGGIFAGAKMFANHQTKVEEAARPEGRVQDWVANLTGEPWIESDGSLKSKAKVHDKDFAAKLEGLQEAGQLGEMGVSIRASGVQTPATVSGVKTSYVEKFVYAKSVDFVTFPGAGGKVDLMESDGQHYLTAVELDEVFAESDANDIDLMPLAVLRERRPDLVESITKEVRENYIMAKTVEELERELKESNEKLTAATAKIAESEKATKHIAVVAELDTKLKEAGLPKVAEDRIRAQFKEATEVTGITEAITAEKTYLKEAGIASKPGVRGLGVVQESGDPEAKQKRVNYIEAMSKTPGFTKEMAEASADDMGL